jgi:hypothetical protein
MRPGRSGYGQVQVLTTSRLSTAARRWLDEDSDKPVSLTASSMALSISWRGSTASSTFFDRLMKSPTPITTGVEEDMVITLLGSLFAYLLNGRKFVFSYLSPGRDGRLVVVYLLLYGTNVRSVFCVMVDLRALRKDIPEVVYCLADAYMGCDWFVFASALLSCNHLMIVWTGNVLLAVTTFVHGIFRRYSRCKGFETLNWWQPFAFRTQK